MDVSDATILEVWNLFYEFIPIGKRNDFAVKYFRILLDGDIDLIDLEDLRGEDEYLDHAFEELDEDLNDDFEEGPDDED